jgi:hypothetical protein
MLSFMICYQGFGPLSPLPNKNGMGNVVGSTEKEEVSHFTRRPLKSVKGLPRQVLSSEEPPCFRCPCVK